MQNKQLTSQPLHQPGGQGCVARGMAASSVSCVVGTLLRLLPLQPLTPSSHPRLPLQARCCWVTRSTCATRSPAAA
jgi:hypothetical protein